MKLLFESDNSESTLTYTYRLEIMLNYQYEHTGNRNDLSETVELKRHVLALSNGSSREKRDLRLTALDNLGDILLLRRAETNDSK